MAELFNIDNMPSSIEAEQAVLGCILKDPKCFVDVSDKVRADEFYMDVNRQIYAAMNAFFAMGKKIDPVLINERLIADGVWSDVEGKQYLLQLAQSVPSVQNAVQYAQVVRDKYYLRTVVNTCNEILGEVNNAGDDAGAVIDLAEKRMYDIRSGRSIANEPKLVGTILTNDVMPKLNKLSTEEGKDLKGINTGYAVLDKTLAGFNKGNLIVIGARPAMGKTSLALNFARNVSLTGKTAVFFSLEMSKEEIAERLLAIDSGVENMKFKSGELDKQEWIDVGRSVARFCETNLYIDDTSALTVPELKSRVRRIPNVDIVFIDYLGLLKSGERKENRVQEVSEITRSLKIMAKELQIPVVTCAQLNRASADGGKARKPVLTDLRESGSVEQDADVVLFLHRDVYYTQPGEEIAENEDTDPSEADLIIAKNRHGDLNNIKLHFDKEHSKFTVLQYVRGSDI